MQLSNIVFFLTRTIILIIKYRIFIGLYYVYRLRYIVCILNYVYDKPCFDRAIVRLHTTLSYDLLYYMYEKPRFIRYHIIYYTIYITKRIKICIISYVYVKYIYALRQYLDICRIKFSDSLT